MNKQVESWKRLRNIVIKEDTMTETRIIEVTIEIINQEGFANLS